ncbi:MAG TPA: nuclear transport factor 2 family protein [Rhizomicrobium sp.]|nr:nuclear transport factor 2 family protein [Rhizomicrobium sp.]
MTSPADMFVLADRVMQAIENNDTETIRACYAPDACIWHNFDGEEQTVDENLRTLGWVDKRLKNRKYEIISRRVFDGGYLQEHILTGTLADGAAFSMPACLVITVRDGRITRLAEYLDSAHVRPLLEA